MQDDKVHDRFERALIALYAQISTYHGEKEKIAYSIIVLEIALLSAAISAHSWILSTVSTRQWLIFFVFAVTVCSLLHYLVRWQLRNRRAAAIQVAAIQTTMLESIGNPLKPEDMRVQMREERARPSSGVLQTVCAFLDWVLPCTRGFKPGSEGALPKHVLQKMEQHRTKAVSSEWIVSAASLVLLSALLYVVYTAPTKQSQAPSPAKQTEFPAEHFAG
jgi:hypothetical protein